MLEPGWLKRQFEKVAAEVAEMPAWWREQTGLNDTGSPAPDADGPTPDHEE